MIHRNAGITTTLAVLLHAGLLAGCERQPASTPPAATAPAPADADAATATSLAHEVVSTSGRYLVRYETDPAAIPLNDVFGLRARIFDAARTDTPLRSVTLTVDARMPAHRHGMNREPEITLEPDGTFLVSGMLMHMPGAWELHFDVTRGAVTERAQVDVTLR
ncbi:MAG: hypothetical protein HKN62_13565 [Phycisphaerales bacterium]|nr:hypothetical protein [Phycisphaerales bacterium]